MTTHLVRQELLCLEELHGGSTLDCAVIDHILVGEIFKGLNGEVLLLAVGVKHGIEVAKVAG